MNVDIWLFIAMPRYEKLSVAELTRGLPLTGFIPIFDPKRTDNVFRCLGEREKVLSFMTNFLNFLFEDILVELVRRSFYVTETSGSRSKLVFYHHQTWARITTPILDELQVSMFQPTDGSSAHAALCRLVPKGKPGKFRPIMSFKKPPSTVFTRQFNYFFQLSCFF